MTKRLEGATLAQNILDDIAAEISKGGITPQLVAVQVGEDAAALRYIQRQLKTAEQIGAKASHIQFPSGITEEEFEAEFKKINSDPNTDAVILMTPLPKNWNVARFTELLSPEKDIEGLHPINLGKMYHGQRDIPLPCTANAAVQLLEYYGRKNFDGLRCAVVGRSANVGLAAALLMQQRNATVTLCHSRTDAKTLAQALENADIVISAAGKAGIINPKKLKKSAWLIDIGTNFVDGKLVGDALPTQEGDIEAYSPVPGGVGALTVAMLMRNLLLLAKQRRVTA